MPRYYFFLQSSRCVSIEQSCLKTSTLYDDFYFYLVYFTSSISKSVLLFHSACFPISPSFLKKFSFLSLYKHNRKAFMWVYAYIYICVYIYTICITCILEKMSYCLAKNFMTFIPFVWLNLNARFLIYIHSKLWYNFMYFGIKYYT